MDEFATVIKIEKIPRVDPPPPLHNTTSLQIEANRILGLSASETQAAAQELYEAGLLSYPRTSSHSITSDMTNSFSALLGSGDGGGLGNGASPEGGGNNSESNASPGGGGDSGSGGSSSEGRYDPGGADPPTPTTSERNYTEEIDVEFKCGPKCNKEEFERQLHNQQEGMKKLSISQFQENRARYKANGRASEGNEAQKNARDKAYEDKINELRAQGMSRNEAKQEADKWMKTQAALHDPDQIAGGNPKNVTGMGARNVNSSIGSQWRTRIPTVDKKVEEFASKLTPDEQKSTYLNMKLHT